jgi:hypothetical protein
MKTAYWFALLLFRANVPSSSPCGQEKLADYPCAVEERIDTLRSEQVAGGRRG